MALVDLTVSLARPAAEAMLNGLWQGTALTALVWCLLRLVPRTNATTRYVIWWGTLIAVICLPVVAGRAPLNADGETKLISYETAAFETSHRRGAESTEGAQRKEYSAAAQSREAPREPELTAQAQSEQARPARSIFPVRLPASWAIFFLAA